MGHLERNGATVKIPRLYRDNLNKFIYVFTLKYTLIVEILEKNHQSINTFWVLYVPRETKVLKHITAEFRGSYRFLSGIKGSYQIEWACKNKSPIVRT